MFFYAILHPKHRATSSLSFYSTMAACGKHFISMFSVESMLGIDRMSNSNLNVLSGLEMMQLLQNTFHVSFVEKDDLRILEVCLHSI